MTADDVGVDDLAGPDAPAVLARLRARGAVVRVPAVDAWLVTTHAAAEQVVRDAAAFTVDDPRFSTAQVVGPSMLSLDGPAHARHRGAFAGPFRPRRVEERFAAEVGELAAALLDRVAADGRADLRTALAGPLAVAVVASALGLHDVDARTVLRWYTAIVAAVSAISAGDVPAPGTAAAVGDLGRHVRRSFGGPTGGDTSVLAEARGVLTDDEIVSDAAVMMFGGIETTEGMIANALVHVLGAPPVRDRIRRDPAAAAPAVEESLRLEPAAAVVDRYATRDVELAGARIGAGDLVRVSLTAANRDPAVFAAPDRFDPDRPDLRRQLAFARGAHVCPAMDLARLETRLAVRAVLAALPAVRLADPSGRSAVPRGLVFRKPPAVDVVWDARRHGR